jgi:hypothetical protein
MLQGTSCNSCDSVSAGAEKHYVYDILPSMPTLETGSSVLTKNSNPIATNPIPIILTLDLYLFLGFYIPISDSIILP